MHYSRIIFSNLCAVLLLVPCASAQTDQIDAYVRADMARRHIPGVSLVVIKDNKLIKASNYGLANVELNVAVNERTSFEIASMTKQFTDAALLLLVEEGKVGLDDSITKYLDGLPATWRDITIRRLMNHTAGLRDDWEEDNNFFLTKNTNEEFLHALTEAPLKFKPGERYGYGCGPFVIGMVIEKVSGKTYAQFMQERIFDPLGMTSTHVNDPFRIVPDRASGYAFKDGALKNGVRISPAAEARGDVGIRTTALDLARWDGAMNDTRLLKPSSLEAMFSWARLNDGSTAPSGLGWLMFPVRGHAVAQHGGGFRTGFSSTINRYLDDHLTVIILNNLWRGSANDTGHIIAGFYNPDYRSASMMTARPDPNPHRTDQLRRLLILLKNGGNDAKLTALTTANFPFTIYEPDDWSRLVTGMKSFSFIDCQDVSARRTNLFRATVNKICFYKVAGEEEKYISFALTAEGKVAYIEPYDY